jgi:hypothetical protein
MPWWETLLDFVGLSRPRINAFVIVCGVIAIVALVALYRGPGMIAAAVCVAVGVAAAITSFVNLRLRTVSWLLTLGGLVLAVGGAVVSIKVLGVHRS